MAGHWGALDYDLMTRTGYTIADIGGALPWASLHNFIDGLDGDSRLLRALNPTEAEKLEWSDPHRVPWVLADIVDELRIIQYLFKSAHSKKGHRPKKPKPYRRPGVSDQAMGEKRIGKDPIPAADFKDWWMAQGEAARRRNKQPTEG